MILTVIERVLIAALLMLAGAGLMWIALDPTSDARAEAPRPTWEHRVILDARCEGGPPFGPAAARVQRFRLVREGR